MYNSNLVNLQIKYLYFKANVFVC